MKPVAQAGPPNVRRKCCEDCGCRKTSEFVPIYDVADLAYEGTEFYCHQGMRPEVQMDSVLWDERNGNVPVKADGSPADLCAGWGAYRRAALREEAALTPRANGDTDG